MHSTTRHRHHHSFAAVFVVAILASCSSGKSSDVVASASSSAATDTAGESTVASRDTTVAVTFAAASQATDTTVAAATGEETLPSAARLAEVAKAAGWAKNVTFSVSGSDMSFSSDGLPSHEYLDTYLADGPNGKYVAGGVTSYDNSHTIPLTPTKLDTPQTTSNGTIGVSISGAVFFNPYEGDGSSTIAIDDQSYIDGVPFIDPCNGHPLPTGDTYHYHGVPYCVSSAIDQAGEHSHIVGYLLDGYPIYGPQGTNGMAPTDLDSCLGHFGPTPEFPEGIYHYHTLTTSPYVPNCFHGQATQAGRRP